MGKCPTLAYPSCLSASPHRKRAKACTPLNPQATPVAQVPDLGIRLAQGSWFLNLSFKLLPLGQPCLLIKYSGDQWESSSILMPSPTLMAGWDSKGRLSWRSCGERGAGRRLPFSFYYLGGTQKDAASIGAARGYIPSVALPSQCL